MAGVILIGVGLGMRTLAIRALGPDFTEIVQVPSRIVREGIYKYFRHPAYTGSLLIVLGLSMVRPELGTLYLAMAFYRSRSIQEDYLLKLKEQTNGNDDVTQDRDVVREPVPGGRVSDADADPA